MWFIQNLFCNVEEEENVFHLRHGNEKIAIAFALIIIAPGTPL
jgi:hypothetical protein